MTALGNVIALIRQLDDEQADVPASGAAPRLQACELPPAGADSSSLGAVMAFIRDVAGSPEFVAAEGRVGVASAAARDAAIVPRARCVTPVRTRATTEMRI